MKGKPIDDRDTYYGSELFEPDFGVGHVPVRKKNVQDEKVVEQSLTGQTIIPDAGYTSMRVVKVLSTGHIGFYIDEHGHLIYTNSTDVPVGFELIDGNLYAGRQN